MIEDYRGQPSGPNADAGCSGGDGSENVVHLNGAARPTPAPGPVKLRGALLGERMSDRRPFLVDGLFRSDTILLVYGKSRAGKTLAMADLCAALALGQPYFGKVVNERCGAFWIAAEKQGEAQPRLMAACRRRGVGPMDRVPPIYIYPPASRITNRDVKDHLLNEVRNAEVRFRPYGVRLGLIVVDTGLAAFELRQDEKCNKDAADVYAYLTELQQATGAAVAMTHHEPKQSTKPGVDPSPLGGHIWLGGAGAAIRIEAPKGPDHPGRTLWLTKPCDGAKPGVIARATFGNVDIGNGDSSDVILPAKGRQPANESEAKASKPKANGKAKKPARAAKPGRSDEQIERAVLDAIKAGAKVRDLPKAVNAARSRCQRAVAALLASGKLVKTEPYDRIRAA